MDKLTPEQRRKNMQAVKSKGSKIETLLAKELWKKGYRYRKNDKTVYGKPDLTFKKYKIAVFVDSEFWHGKNWKERKNDKKIILLFVREKNKDEYGNTMGYVFVGEGQLKEHYGAKPMNIKWELNEPLPNYLWKDAAKLRVG
jgi:DNA mismatch endonuclease Vsr